MYGSLGLWASSEMASGRTPQPPIDSGDFTSRISIVGVGIIESAAKSRQDTAEYGGGSSTIVWAD
jgi:hypothetical protein